MADYISREAAINTQERRCLGCPVDRRLCYKCAVTTTTKQLLELPAADVRPVKIGRYVTDDMGDSSCSECGEKYLDITKRFCPECGAELRRNDGDQ